MQSGMRPRAALASEQLGQNFSSGNCFLQMTPRFCQQFQLRHHRVVGIAAATGTNGIEMLQNIRTNTPCF